MRVGITKTNKRMAIAVDTTHSYIDDNDVEDAGMT